MTTTSERAALRAAMKAATARPWDTVQMSEDRDGCAVMAGHQHEGFVADTMYAPNGTAIKLAANLAERLCDHVDAMETALRAIIARVEEQDGGPCVAMSSDYGTNMVHPTTHTNALDGTVEWRHCCVCKARTALGMKALANG